MQRHNNFPYVKLKSSQRSSMHDASSLFVTP
jgi:hypothetical protein